MIAAVALLPMCAHAVFAINDPWVKAAPGARVAEAYMELRSSEDIVLVGVRSAAVAGIAALLDAEHIEVAQEGAQALAGPRLGGIETTVDLIVAHDSSARICSAR